MPLRRAKITWLLILGALALLGPSGALATGPSAGDQQYVDPLAGSTTPGTHSATPSSPPSSSSASPSSASAATVTPTATATATASPTATSATQSSAGTLPRTGMDSWLAAAIGAGLVATGLALRRQALQRQR